ncbi:substrate-binding domain-containing protein [Dactylosporangium darangshiense]|uniref:PBP domain-containing protein n=1 Tax=Dactylosporangium darangshiense TaxID=579108 RepID=A0ABP8DQ67_9ACTN
MMIRFRAVGAAIVLGALLSVAGIAGPAAAAGYVTISGGGSTMAFNAFQAWSGNVAQFGMRVDYERSGNTAGRSKFREGVYDWAVSDIPYGVDDQPPVRGYTYVPSVAVATTFVYNLKIGTTRVTNLRLSGETVTKIFTGALTRWNDPAIAADNPGLALPAIPIVPVVRSDSAGTTLQFTRWMAARHGPTCGCVPTSAFPVPPGSGMIAQPGDLGVSGYVGQYGANGTIGTGQRRVSTTRINVG